MKLLVVIVNYRVAHLTIDCLRSIAPEIGRFPGIHVAVCENGTDDESAARIRSAIDDNGWSPWCTLSAVCTNLGFTGGNNVVIRWALQLPEPPEYVLLLNADTVVRPNALGALVDFMDSNPTVGIGGSRLEDPDGTPLCSAFRYPSPFSEFDRGLNLGAVTRILDRWRVAPPNIYRACETDWVAGASMIVRRQVFGDIGLLDEGFFTHFEDVDFCLNAQRAGWSVWYVPDSRVVHLVGQSTGLTVANPKRHPTYYFDARRRYFLKNHGAVYAAAADAALLAGLALWRVRVALGKRDHMAPNVLFDSARHSVFLRGFTVPVVQNPAMQASYGYPLTGAN
jgi:N-acetylglucosaminyl-diphospho-decaprenol L-rhamnosyltransferase